MKEKNEYNTLPTALAYYVLKFMNKVLRGKTTGNEKTKKIFKVFNKELKEKEKLYFATCFPLDCVEHVER